MPKDLYSPDQTRLQELLRRVRQEAGLRQEDLALRLGVAQSFVSKYESGERRLDFLEVREICKALGVSFRAFVDVFEDSLK